MLKNVDARKYAKTMPDTGKHKVSLLQRINPNQFTEINFSHWNTECSVWFIHNEDFRNFKSLAIHFLIINLNVINLTYKLILHIHLYPYMIYIHIYIYYSDSMLIIFDNGKMGCYACEYY